MVGKLAVSLDRMCKGRMALNIVNGWFDEEFRMFGGTVLQGEERYRRTVEFIDILRGLWANETFSYDGQFYKVDKGQLLLKPASPTAPEIYSVSRSDRGRDFIAEHCDWWFVDMPKDTETIDDTVRGIEANIADMDRRTKADRPQGALRAQSVRGARQEPAGSARHDHQADLRPRSGSGRAQDRKPDAAGDQGRPDRLAGCRAAAAAALTRASASSSCSAR